MSNTTPYSARWRGPSLIEKGKAWTVAVDVEHGGSAPTITAATFSLWKPGGENAVNAATAVISSGNVSYQVPAATTTDEAYGMGWVVRFDCTIGGVVFPFYNDAAVVAAHLFPPVGTTDLTNRYSQLATLRKLPRDFLRIRTVLPKAEPTDGPLAPGARAPIDLFRAFVREQTEADPDPELVELFVELSQAAVGAG